MMKTGQLIPCAEPGRTLEIYANGNFVASAITSKKGELKINKKSLQGKDLLKALNKKRQNNFTEKR